MNLRLLWVVLLLVAVPLRADIYEWRDGRGHRHFTNSMLNVPEAHQAGAKVFVVGLVGPEGSAPREAVAAPMEPLVREETPREPLVIYSSPRPVASYEQGIEDGLALAQSLAQPEEPRVLINGPLAVANANPSVDLAPFYPAAYYQPYHPFVTTSFDRGRSRHLTLRMLLQEQFQFDRDGPYTFEVVQAPRLRPRFKPFLSRGLANKRTLAGGHNRPVKKR